ncbi:MAG: cytochrome-c peroxidase [Bacteroidota bacterium]
MKNFLFKIPFLFALFLVGLIFVVLSCSVDPEIKPSEPPLSIKEIIPAGFPQPVYNFQNNGVTTDKFILGRALFYDPILSADNTISCGSCHQAFAAFANASHDLSHGINGLLGTRNSPALQNLNWKSSFMWDGGINHLEIQPIAPIQNPIEMGENLNNVIVKLQSKSKYLDLFRKAFGNDSITSQRMLKAMAVFMGTLYSYNSKYDRYYRGESGISFTSSELNGYNIFKSKCNGCHKEPLLTDESFRNNGLAVNPLINDSGRMMITGDPNDKFKFKVPSLRNVSVTSPYMHDGRFNSLSEVIDHYRSGVQQSNTLDPSLSSGIPLTNQEKADVINFLYTLTDYQFLYDEKFKDPN